MCSGVSDPTQLIQNPLNFDLHKTFFKFYILYHSIPPSDIYVLEHNALSHIRTCVRNYPVNVVQMTTNSTSYNVKPRVQKLQQLQHSLLKQYEHVLIADLDEWFLPDPILYKNLYDYLEKQHFEEFIAPIGYEILPEDNVIDWSRPVLKQRVKMGRLCGMDKPTLTRIPLRYTFATHAVPGQDKIVIKRHPCSRTRHRPRKDSRKT